VGDLSRRREFVLRGLQFGSKRICTLCDLDHIRIDEHRSGRPRRHRVEAARRASPDWIKVKNPDAPAATRVMEW